MRNRFILASLLLAASMSLTSCMDDMGPVLIPDRAPVHLPSDASALTLNDQEPEGPDFRQSFLGNFRFSLVQRSWSAASGSWVYSDTVFFDGTVAKINQNDNGLRINYGAGNNFVYCGEKPVFGSWIEPLVSPNGSLSHTLIAHCSSASYFLGGYADYNHLHMEANMGDADNQTTHLITGIRQ